MSNLRINRPVHIIRRGDIFYISENYRETASEQRAGRPGIVVSNNDCNKHSDVIEVVFLTTRPKSNLPTHVRIQSARYPSTALCEQIASVSIDRLQDYSGHCTKREMEYIDTALAISLGIDIKNY